MGLRLLLGWGLSVRFWKGVGVEALERWKVEKVFFLDKGVWRGFWVKIGGLDWWVLMKRVLRHRGGAYG